MTDFFNDDLSDLIGSGARTAPLPAEYAAIREAAKLFTEACPKCQGTGKFRSWSGRTVGDCFTCKGKGSRTFKTSSEQRQANAARKEKAEAEAFTTFKTEYPVEFEWMVAKAPTFGFALNMLEALRKWGSLTPNQLAAVTRCAARDQEKQTQKQVVIEQRKAEAPGVDVTKIATALNLAYRPGQSMPRLRLGNFIFSLADPDGRNAGAIFVKARTGDREYFGKIVDGRFLAARACTQAQTDELIKLASDPAAAAVEYGRQIGSCACCGRQLVDPVSVARGIGPICAERFGF